MNKTVITYITQRVSSCPAPTHSHADIRYNHMIVFAILHKYILIHKKKQIFDTGVYLEINMEHHDDF